MANTYFAGSAYVEANGSVISGRIRIAQILFTSTAASDSVIISDSLTTGTPVKLYLRGGTGKETTSIIMPVPMLFEKGVYVSALSANCTLTFITIAAGE